MLIDGCSADGAAYGPRVLKGTPGYPDCFVVASFQRGTATPQLRFGPGSVHVVLKALRPGKQLADDYLGVDTVARANVGERRVERASKLGAFCTDPLDGRRMGFA